MASGAQRVVDRPGHHPPGGANVLFMDGSVEARQPDQIDPYYPANRDAYWVSGQ